MEGDTQFVLTIPSYDRVNDLIVYNFKIQDTIKNKTYFCNFRFKELQQYQKQLLTKNFELPQFPKTHFWVKTNKDPKLIQQRRYQLEAFFNKIINDPALRGQKQIKNFILACKKSLSRDERCRSQEIIKSQSGRIRNAKSLKREKPNYGVEISLVKLK